MRAVASVLATAVVVACGEGERPSSAGTSPVKVVRQWVAEGDCALMTDRYVAQGYPTVAEGRRGCQEIADKTPVERYRVESSTVRDEEAMVALRVAGGALYTFWLVNEGRSGWRIDGYEDQAAGEDTIASAQIIAAFERETGERLERLPELSEHSFVTLGFVNPTAEQARRFGFFAFQVTDSAAEAKMLTGPEDVRVRNVLLVWNSETDDESRHDRRRRRLASILRDLP